MKLISIFVVLFFPLISVGQDQKRASPLSLATARYQDTYIKIMYGQPSKRDRKIFGGLVPFGKVWRTGANEATEITLTKNVMVNGKELKKGTYSLFTIPNKDKWTIIFNAELGLWGSYNYNVKKDVLRFDVPTERTNSAVEPASYEHFLITIESKEPETGKADIKLSWDNTRVSFPIQYLVSKSRP